MNRTVAKLIELTCTQYSSQFSASDGGLTNVKYNLKT
jgi:hypothetical protein